MKRVYRVKKGFSILSQTFTPGTLVRFDLTEEAEQVELLLEYGFILPDGDKKRREYMTRPYCGKGRDA